MTPDKDEAPRPPSGPDGTTPPQNAAHPGVDGLTARITAIMGRVVIMMDKSRRLQAELVWRQYGHLIDEGYWVAGPASADCMDDFDRPNRS